MNDILLIDDEVWEKEFIGFTFQKVFGQNFRLDHASRGGEAVKLLFEKEYSLILVDNNLSPQTNAQFTIPFLKECSGNAEIVVISHNILEDYLEDPILLGVDHVIAKTQLQSFLESIRNRNYGRLAASGI